MKRVRQALLNMGVLQLATTSLSVLTSQGTDRQTQSGSVRFKISDLPKFWISWIVMYIKCIV